MNYFTLFVILFFALISTESAECIGGRMKGSLFKGDYIVTETILVMENEKLTIWPGCRLYFEQFCGLRVSGELSCIGNLSEPILLTSIKAMEKTEEHTSAEAFDWNGLEITSEAKSAEFAYTRISHCTFGIQVKSKNSIINLSNVIFDDIGYSSLCRETKLIDVKPNIPFSITWKPYNSDLSDHRFEGKEHDGISPEKRRKKAVFRTGCGAVGLCGGLLLVISSVMVNRTTDLYNAQRDPSGADYCRKLFYKSRVLQYTGGAVLATGITGAGISFLF
ncbi:MAG: hypothetical protein GX267_07160 [Fibrobacter sp.]|jgi:hypothetical protein|nr:hypothetical protein [Fibrobacter sp.]